MIDTTSANGYLAQERSLKTSTVKSILASAQWRKGDFGSEWEWYRSIDYGSTDSEGVPTLGCQGSSGI